MNLSHSFCLSIYLFLFLLLFVYPYLFISFSLIHSSHLPVYVHSPLYSKLLPLSPLSLLLCLALPRGKEPATPSKFQEKGPTLQTRLVGIAYRAWQRREHNASRLETRGRQRQYTRIGECWYIVTRRFTEMLRVRIGEGSII